MTDTNTDLRERAVLPVLIPLLAIVLTEIIVFSMSRVLLAVEKNMSVVIALGTALAILIGATFIAARPRLRSTTVVGLLVVLGIGAVGAGAVALKQGPHYLKEEAANRRRDRPPSRVSAAASAAAGAALGPVVAADWEQRLHHSRHHLEPGPALGPAG